MSFEQSIAVCMTEYAKWLDEHKERLRDMPEGERIDLFFEEVVLRPLSEQHHDQERPRR
jgi:hypothetical protein